MKIEVPTEEEGKRIVSNKPLKKVDCGYVEKKKACRGMTEKNNERRVEV